MSPLIRNLILYAGAIALVASTVRGVAALPGQLHKAGVAVPGSWEQLLVEIAEGR
jgi:hypothetical protein